MGNLDETLPRKPLDEEPAPRSVARIVHSPDREAIGRSLELDGRVWFIGRGVKGGGGVQDGRMSREHARLSPRDDAYVVEDLGTSNGTFVDGERVARARPVIGGSVLSLGETLIVVDREPKTVSLPVAEGADERGLEDEVVGISFVVQRLRRSIATVARAGGTVLLLGATGTGKEIAARAIHGASPLASGPFVPVNCAAVPADIAEAEFFGYKQGAFTGAVADRKGYFVQAASGTLFLDEIGDLPLSLQAKLLRVLEDGSIRPLGSGDIEKVDVRVIAATNVDLEQSEFRKDLLARIADWTLRLPTLAERRADVLPLFRHFLQTDSPGSANASVTSDFAEALLLYDWPMNVRELRKLARRSAAMSGGQDLKIDLLAEELKAPFLERTSRSSERAVKPAPAQTEDGADKENEGPGRAALEKALVEAKGNVRRVAESLGVHRTQLYRWMRRAGLDPADYR